MDEVAEHLRGLSGYNKKGEEIPDSKPVEMPIGFQHPPSLQETMRRLLTSEFIKRDLQANGIETFDEADDFDEDKDETFDRTTPYEDDFDPENPGLAARQQEIRSGFVEEMPKERIDRAREVLERAGRNSGKSKAPPKKKPAKAEEEEESHGEEESDE